MVTGYKQQVVSQHLLRLDIIISLKTKTELKLLFNKAALSAKIITWNIHMCAFRLWGVASRFYCKAFAEFK